MRFIESRTKLIKERKQSAINQNKQSLNKVQATKERKRGKRKCQWNCKGKRINEIKIIKIDNERLPVFPDGRTLNGIIRRWMILSSFARSGNGNAVRENGRKGNGRE